MKFYWPSELYSFGKYYRKYGRYPRLLPLLFYSDHSSPSFDSSLETHEIENDANLYFTFSEKKKLEIEKLTCKMAYVIMSPQIYYRRHYNISVLSNKKGTVAFPDHILPGREHVYSLDQYCNDLLKLPKKFHPITICLHMHDLNIGSDRVYKKHGFNVVSAGDTSHRDFISNLYGILINYKYITTNMVNTISMLSLEIKHNFFIYPNIDLDIENKFGVSQSMKDHFLYQFVKNKTLEKADVNLDEDIYKEIEFFFGITNGISRSKFTFLIWKQFIIELFTLELFVKYKRKIYEIISNRNFIFFK